MKKYNLIFEDKQGNELKKELLIGYTKKEALKRFLNAHPFLDAENANNPNFSRNLFETGNQDRHHFSEERG